MINCIQKYAQKIDTDIVSTTNYQETSCLEHAELQLHMVLCGALCKPSYAQTHLDVGALEQRARESCPLRSSRHQ